MIRDPAFLRDDPDEGSLLGSSHASIVAHREVDAALRDGRPVVALESAVITHGLPRGPAPQVPGDLARWDPALPANLQAARKMQETVRDAGAIPAIVAVIDGELRIGLDDSELEQLALQRSAEKASAATLAGVMSRGVSAGATVSATLIACRSAPAPIRTFATGGIGGVHAHWTKRPDISVDLLELSRSAVCVVSSGAKSILDLPATVEALEALGVALIGVATNRFAGFYVREIADLVLPERAENARSIADLCSVHWLQLQQTSAVLAVNPVPVRYALDRTEVEAVLEQAERAASARDIAGGARTPFLLEEIARQTDGRSLTANVALLLNNARVAAEIACSLQARNERRFHPADG